MLFTVINRLVPLLVGNLNVADKVYFVAAILAPAVTMILPFFTKVKMI
jgi:hypothetical protein